MNKSKEPREKSADFFDKALQEVAKHSLLNSVCIQQTESFRQIYQNATKIFPSISSKIQASGLFQDYHQFKKVERSFNKNEYENGFELSFQYIINKGGRLPKIVGRPILFQRRVEELTHIPGEVLIVVLIMEWSNTTEEMINRLQAMLRKNKSIFGDKVRVVAINSVDSTPSKVTNEKGNNICWKQVQHLELPIQSAYMANLKQSNSNYIVVLNQNGVIQYVKQFVNDSFELKISQLCKKNNSENKQIQKEVKSIKVKDYNNEEWIKLKLIAQDCQLLQILEQSFEGKRVKKYEFGVRSQVIEPLKIRYSCSKDQLQKTHKWLWNITKKLSPEQYEINGFVNDPQISLSMNLQKVAKILRRNGIEKPPKIIEEFSCDLIFSQTFTTKQKILYPELIYKKDCSFSQGKRIKQQVQEALHQSSQFKTFDFYQRYPWKIVGARFTGIFGLYCVTNEQKKDIIPTQNKTTIIYKWTKYSNIWHVRGLMNIIENNVDKINLHIIMPIKISRRQIQALLKKAFVYLEQLNEDLDAYFETISKKLSFFGQNVETVRDTLVIDKNGLISKEGMLQTMQNMDLKFWIFPMVSKSQSLANIIQQIPKLPQIQNFRKISNQWDYTADLRITCGFNDGDHGRKIEYARLTGTIRDEHHQSLSPLIDLLCPQGVQIQVKYIQTIIIPDGKECFDCQDQLHLPYYYFPWSKVHRCVDCTETEDLNQKEKMKRFAVNENSVLLSAPNTQVDAIGLGHNTQFKQSSLKTRCFSARSKNFVCNLCQLSKYNASYSCLGCSRLLTLKREFQACVDCIKKMRGTADQQRSVIQQYPQGHRKEHPFIRKLERQ